MVCILTSYHCRISMSCQEEEEEDYKLEKFSMPFLGYAD